MLTQWRKSKLRDQALAARQSAHAGNPEAGQALVPHFPDSIWPSIHQVVAGYHPIRDEMNPYTLMEVFYCEQVRLALPCVEQKDHPLVFRHWQPGQTLVKGAFGTREPEATAPEVRPSLLLMPLVAFDEKGGRLGYGGGYYDRTLEALQAIGPVTTVGLAYDAQKVRAVPQGRYDVRLDWIVTEKGAYQGVKTGAISA